MKSQRMFFGGFMLAALVAPGCAGADYPCWRGADGSGAAPSAGVPLVSDISQAKWAWESEEKRMSSCYGYIQGGIGGIAVADGRVYHPYGYPGGEADPAMQAKFLAFFTRMQQEGGRKAESLTQALGTTGYTIAELAEVMARPQMHDTVIAIDAATGRTVWKQTFPTARRNMYGRPAGRNAAQPEGVGSFGPAFKPKAGPHNVPAAAYGKVAIVGYGGTLYCLDAATGKEAWRAEVVPHADSDLDFGDRALRQASVLYGGGNFVCFSTTARGYVAFDAATGQQRWTFRPGYTPNGPQGGVRFTLGGRDLMLYGNIGVDLATGATLWTITDGLNAVGSPCVGEGHVVLSGGKNKEKEVGVQCYRLAADPTQPPQRVWALEGRYRCRLDCTSTILGGKVYAKLINADNLPGGETSMAAIDLATGKMNQLGIHTDCCNSLVATQGWLFDEGYYFRTVPRMEVVPEARTLLQNGDNSPLYANSHTPPCVGGRLYIKGHNSIRCLDLRAAR